MERSKVHGRAVTSPGLPEAAIVSVINKMLRDLDQRANAPAVSSAPQSLARSTIRLAPGVTAGSGAAAWRGGYSSAVLAGLLVCLTVAGGGWWVGLRDRPPTRSEVRTVPAAVPALIQTAVVQPVQVVSVLGPAEPNRTGNETLTGAISAAPAVNSARAVRASVQSVPTPVPLAGSPRESVAFKAEHRLAPSSSTTRSQTQPQDDVGRGALMVQASPVVSSPATPVIPVPVSTEVHGAEAPGLQWQGAAAQALAQAQQLWNAGSRDAATHLLTESLLVLERVHAAELAGPGSTVALSLVRELVRMDLAQAQPDAALAVLKRQDRMVSGQADLLASRGNAAQRVGQHLQASQSYQAALMLRPGEPRWMLGEAISLAAMGQLDAAAELVEQARGLGTIKPDVLAYLKQLGVQLREH
jgi:MSHA biogenesis protein MshN